jgi:hypothetical protein
MKRYMDCIDGDLKLGQFVLIYTVAVRQLSLKVKHEMFSLGLDIACTAGRSLPVVNEI